MLFSNLTHAILGTSPTNDIVDGEPQDVEKNTYNRPRTLSASFKASEHGFKPASSSYQSPTYRGLPIISGILIPFSILLAIPSLTSRWYVRTDPNGVILDTRPNSLLLNIGMGFSMACGVLANVCLVVRFAERNVLTMTWSCITLLTLHDLINISAVSLFGVQAHRSHNGFTFGQSFWFTFCSTIISTATNITLIIDYYRTKDFVNSGSGLTPKQRSLVIIIIVLLTYLALGSLIQTFMLDISFIDAIYFCVVTIETIGFGDIHPTTAGTRIFNSFYIAGGILNLAVAVALIREVLLEGAALGFQDRVKAVRIRQRERRIRTRWRTAVKLRLRANNLPMWVVDSSDEHDKQDWQYHHYHHLWRWAKRIRDFLRKSLSRKPTDRHHHNRKHLNLQALTETQMEEAALEAGAPLADLLPPGLHLGSPSTGYDMEGDDDDEQITDRGGVPFTQSLTMQDEASLEDTLVAEEKIAFAARLTVSLLVFIVFWMAGSVIFMKTENWDFGTAVYFCFIAFTTEGYGDISPKTPAGRSIFVAWALLGVAAMTILISILVEAYSNQFKSVTRTDSFADSMNTTDHGNGSRQLRFVESPGTVHVRTEEGFISSIALATSSGPGHRDWEPKMAPIPEDGFKHKKEGLESLHDILRHAQTLRHSLISPEDCPEDAILIESTSNPTDWTAPQGTPPSDTVALRRKVHKVCQIEKTMQEIINAAECALDVYSS